MAQNATPEFRPDQAIDRLRRDLGFDQMDEVDKMMLGYVLTKPAITDRDLGVLVGLSREAINHRRNRPLFKRAIDEAMLDAYAIFQRNMAKAARKVGQLLDSQFDAIALRAAELHIRPMLARLGAGGGDSTGNAAEDLMAFLEQSYEDRRQRGLVKSVGSASTVDVPAEPTTEGEGESKVDPR